MARVSIVHLGKDAPPRGKQKAPTRILGDVSIEVASGEFLVLVGPSGCGKTTLLRCIAGLEAPTRGELLLDGARVNEKEPRERDIAMVFQSYALYPHLTVRDNLAFGLRVRKTPLDEIGRRIDEAARMLRIGDYLERFPRELSGGQMQRVAMGRAVVRRPRVFLFDEPLSNLDAALRGEMRVELKRLHQRLSATMVYVTHDQVEAMTLADRICVLRAGAVEQLGTPRELYEQPANLFVARFLGTPEMNTVAGRLEAGAFVGGGLRCELGRAAPADGEVTLGVRSEDLAVRPIDEAGATSHGRARVDVVENLGWESLVHMVLSPSLQRAPSSEYAGGTPLVARVETARAPRVGEQVAVTVAVERAHLFGKDGARRATAAVASH